MTFDPRDDNDLATVLTGLGDHLEVPDGAGLATWRPAARQADRSADRTGRSADRRPRRVLALAAGVALVVGAGAFVVGGPVRDAAAQVGEWLGLGGTRIEEGPADPTGLAPISDDLTPVAPSSAEAWLGRPLPVVGDPGLGPPDVVAVPPEGGVLLGWDEGATTLWVRAVVVPPGAPPPKVRSELGSATEVDGLGEAAVLIEDDHVLVTPHRRVAAGAVLLWVDGGWEYRLESDLPRADLLAAARSVR